MSERDQQLKSDFQQVKELGDRIGYGHMMSCASALWRESAREKGYPEVGAFVPTCIPFLEGEYRDIAEKTAEQYDALLDNCNKI